MKAMAGHKVVILLSGGSLAPCVTELGANSKIHLPTGSWTAQLEGDCSILEAIVQRQLFEMLIFCAAAICFLFYLCILDSML